MANYQPICAGPGAGTHSHPISQGIEAASQSFKDGAIVIKSSGKIAIATNGNDAPVLGAIVGVALGPAKGVTDSEVLFIPAFLHVIFEATLDTTAGTLALAASHLYGTFGLEKDSTSGHFYIDQGDTGDIRVVVVGLKDPIGTVSGRVYFRFLPGATAYDAAAANV